MKIRDLKYLLAYLIPISAFIALVFQSFWSYSTVILAFLILPLIELSTRPDPVNHDINVEQQRRVNRFFDWLLYLNIPIIYLLIIMTARAVYQGTDLLTTIGLTLNLGIVLSTAGINVAHEIGHRKGIGNKIAASLLLIPSLYGHFTIEHNNGHHKWVATPDDPVTAKYNQSIYSFIFTAVYGVYMSAWKIAFRSMERQGLPKFHYKNELIWISIAQVILLGIYHFAGGWMLLLIGICAAVVSFCLLETIDYVEHYGLQRKLLPSGKYERVSERHSWNSDHEMGRIFLYELTRHTDHHMHANRKYQTLRHMDGSPQLPYGYPASILMALVPPIWFKTMNPRVKAYNS